ncbi:type II toxin-antitoxin system antitoxin HipB [[Erwinia] mediterraneensis]|uniref:type II toxin-antitoxin system antitoxin HipB n=1 Tax=[Erwinia] mediterraneensis TaxID=2161819 RepID=UPI00102F76D9|nr:type II toxin-antitoxin system antitoxin HipB [[Erwinia] mediterraneensis]
MIYSPRQLAHYLKLIRQKNHWTQSELARKVGLKQSTISHFENNPDMTTLATLFKILQALELQMNIPEQREMPAHPADHSAEDNEW